jgi:hypothetical protein
MTCLKMEQTLKWGQCRSYPRWVKTACPLLSKLCGLARRRGTHTTHTHTHTPHAHTRLFHALPPPHRHCGIMTLGNAALVLHRNASLAPPMRASSQGTQVEPFFTLRPHSTFFFVHSLTHSSTPTHSHTPLLPACPTQPELSEEESAAIMVTEKGPEEA